MKCGSMRIWAVALVASTLTLSAGAQVVGQDPSATSDDLAISRALDPSAVGTIVPQRHLFDSFAPTFTPITLAWISAVVVLVLTFQSRRLRSAYNLDALMLAVVGLLMVFRTHMGLVPGAGTTAQWWSYVLLSAACGYWLIRGLYILHAKRLPPLTPNVSEGALTLLVLAGLAVAAGRIMNAPISDASRDGLLGGVCFADTGKLPYGDIDGADSRSPLVYLLHAGVVAVLPPRVEADTEFIPMTWVNRSEWQTARWWEHVDRAPIRVVNALLFVLMFAGLALIGHRQHSVAMGLMLCAMFCFFPGTLECLNRPDVMLPACLLTWALAFVNVPVLGGILALVCVIAAGLAWPWSWLALPVLLGFFFARGWNSIGATLGLAAGIVASVAGLMYLVSPSLPRVDGALKAAGMQPAFAAHLADDGAVVVERYAKDDEVQSTFRSWLWKYLLESESTTLANAELRASLPNGIDAGDVQYRRLAVSPDAHNAVQAAYRQALAKQPQWIRLQAATRTVLESTWRPAEPPHAPYKGAWELWAGGSSIPENTWTWARRGAKLFAGLLALVAMFSLVRHRRARRAQLVGGLLAVGSAALFASSSGAADDLVWIAPFVLAAFAASAGAAAAYAPPPSLAPLPRTSYGPAPRISIEAGPPETVPLAPLEPEK